MRDSYCDSVYGAFVISKFCSAQCALIPYTLLVLLLIATLPLPSLTAAFQLLSPSPLNCVCLSPLSLLPLSQDGNLRRMVYLFLKAVADSTDASSLIIVTQSLVKDMFNETPLYKGNAL